MRITAACAVLAGLLCVADPAHALNRYVGTGTGCTNATIQSAVNDLDNNGVSLNFIYVARNQTYTSQDIDIDMPGQLLVIYGVASCTDVVPNGFTQISGAGGNTDPVFKISNTDYVEMRNLHITGGDHETDNEGGGIRFQGAGTLVLQDIRISLNTAGSGGGVAMIEQGGSFEAPAELIIQQGVSVSSNTARYDGGGIYLKGHVEMTLFDQNSFIEGNAALGQATGLGGSIEGGHGGGIYLRDLAIARIGSGGLRIGNANAIEVIQNNSARYGGGIASDGSAFYVYQTAAGFPPALKNNLADVAGGAIWQQGRAQFAGYSTLIDTKISGNHAPEGAVVYGETDFGALDYGALLLINVRRTTPYPSMVRCAAGEMCSQVVGNTATGANGAIIHMENEGALGVAATLFSGNTAHHLFDLDDGDGTFPKTYFRNVQITDNALSGPLFVYRDMELPIQASTIAGNSVGAAVLLQGSDLKLSRSIVFQPGKQIVSSLNGLELTSNLVHPFPGLVFQPGGFDSVDDALFMDDGRGDYRLRAHSPAIDFAVPTTDSGPDGSGDGTADVLGNPRVVDLVQVPNFIGVQDIGAHERPSVGNLVRNPGFVDDPIEDLRLWNYSIAPPASFSSIDRSGMAGSGSIQISALSPSATAAIQCIGVPGPGTLRLTGYAYTTQVVNGDFARLRWQRHDDSSDCQSSPSAFGVVSMRTSLGGWQPPLQDAYITVDPLQWTPNTSILVSLLVEDGADQNNDSFGRFDDISLTYDTEPQSGGVFANGFEGTPARPER